MPPRVRRLLLAIPFLIAGVLNLLVDFANKFHLRRQHMAGYCFLFGAPWAWLTDHDWLGGFSNRWYDYLVGYAAILWIPALLYACCLWLILRGFRYWASKSHMPQ